MEQTMPADKFGRFMTSDTFLTRANAAVAAAVRRLEKQGIVPAYIRRQPEQQSKSEAAPGNNPPDVSPDVTSQHESPDSK
ncbi:hypothetical protein [Ralstonia flaminis]|jgi:hypothetical protein|uniref:Uncharacterized protein n=1 Tax=Ralstonia flaminis TaxID=3058597 RepID=A0ABM9K0V2_9RALS|nr:hypothetical protein [Ralstonia sp. LMG 18101]CAJ0810693.1 hypothetical protein LMG18101_00964 [Ralstonia sp. LMG 18101]